VKALGPRRAATLVGVDPGSGRILTIVNQKLAFEPYRPCSTFKPAVALAALEEGLIENDRTRLQLGRRWYLDLNRSLTISNNLYFEKLGGLLGLDKMRDYAQRFGFGELSGWGLPNEPRGALPAQAPPASRGGVGRIASFGEGIEQTPLQLASFMSAVANGGTLFYLQYSLEEGRFEPLVKRRLEIARCMMTRPRILMLDEPAAGLNPKETEDLKALIALLRDEHGVTVLLIEHDMKLVMSISDHIYVINQGTPLANGSPEQVRNNPDVIKAYLGEA